MCSWCWAFKPAWDKVKETLLGKVKVDYLLGGLAPDSNEPMPIETREYVKGNWKRIQGMIPDIRFNYDFWTSCEPKRSTYPACRAVICAKQQHPDFENLMIYGIQKSYYLEAQNPSNDDVLINIAESLGLDTDKFKIDLKSSQVNEILLNEIKLARSMDMNSMPSLVLQINGTLKVIDIDYLDANYIVKQIIP
ncbi:MAG: DsbA family protein [Gammaproteobacteria bacterium]